MDEFNCVNVLPDVQDAETGMSRRAFLQASSAVAGGVMVAGRLASIGSPVAPKQTDEVEPASPNEPKDTEWDPEYEGEVNYCSIDNNGLIGEGIATLRDYEEATRLAALTQLGVTPRINCDQSAIYDSKDYLGNQYPRGAGIADNVSALLTYKRGEESRDFETFDFAPKSEHLSTTSVVRPQGVLDVYVSWKDITERYHGLNFFSFNGAIFNGGYGYIQMAYPAPTTDSFAWHTLVDGVEYLSVSAYVGYYPPVEAPEMPGYVKIFTVVPANTKNMTPTVQSYSIAAARLMQAGYTNQIYLNQRLDRTRPLTVWEQANQMFMGALEGIQDLLPKGASYEEVMYELTRKGQILPHDLYLNDTETNIGVGGVLAARVKNYLGRSRSNTRRRRV